MKQMLCLKSVVDNNLSCPQVKGIFSTFVVGYFMYKFKLLEITFHRVHPFLLSTYNPFYRRTLHLGKLARFESVQLFERSGQ